MKLLTCGHLLTFSPLWAGCHGRPSTSLDSAELVAGWAVSPSTLLGAVSMSNGLSAMQIWSWRLDGASRPNN